ncbi:hypothetical protein EDD16DRAFT_1456011, partial [Pisolithus croceorrhizus]
LAPGRCGDLRELDLESIPYKLSDYMGLGEAFKGSGGDTIFLILPAHELKIKL